MNLSFYYQDQGVTKNSNEWFWISPCTTNLDPILPEFCGDLLCILQNSNANFWEVWFWIVFRKMGGWGDSKENNAKSRNFPVSWKWRNPSKCHNLGPFHLFLMLDPSIHPKFWQTSGKLQLLYIPKFLCFKLNFLELETWIYSILMGLLPKELKLYYDPGHLFFWILIFIDARYISFRLQKDLEHGQWFCVHKLDFESPTLGSSFWPS